jgi:hypothetical protein
MTEKSSQTNRPPLQRRPPPMLKRLFAGAEEALRRVTRRKGVAQQSDGIVSA